MNSMSQAWSNKLALTLVVLVAFIDGGLVAGQFYENTPKSTAVEAMILEDIFEQKSSSIQVEELIPLIVQSVSFTSQAPYGVWDRPWSDYAEEACILMAQKWATGLELGTADDVADELLGIGEWEGEQFGTSKNTDILQNLRILKEYFGLQAELSYDLSRETLLAALDEGKILLLPVNGQTLDNPHYGEPGPEHHMILVYAYEGDTFLANDPGTVKGKATSYGIEKILESIQDLNGERRILVISR